MIFSKDEETNFNVPNNNDFKSFTYKAKLLKKIEANGAKEKNEKLLYQ